MKWRNVAIYTVVLIILAGYFYYFEVLKKREKERIEEEEKKVFSFMADDVSSIRIVRNNDTIHIEKEKGQWVMLEPVKADVDQASVREFINVMADIEADRWIDVNQDKLKEYSLDKPTLMIEATTSQGTYTISIGTKNPAETHYYAHTGKDNRIFLMNLQRWNILNKDVYDLRRKELAIFETDQVQSLSVVWSDGTAVVVQKTGEVWSTQDHPDVKIKTIKVENVLDQLKWLRAGAFLEDESNPEGTETPFLEKYSLNKPKVEIKIGLKDKPEIRLLFQEPKKENDKTHLVAYSSDLHSVIRVNQDILNELPRTLRDLEDRSLFTWTEEIIGRISWRDGEERMNISHTEGEKWNITIGSNTEPKELKESWRIRSFFWDLEDMEYDSIVEPLPQLPEKFRYSLEFFDRKGKQLTTWKWLSLPEDGTKEASEEYVTVWIKEKGAVKVKVSDIEDMIDKLSNLKEKGKESKESKEK